MKKAKTPSGQLKRNSAKTPLSCRKLTHIVTPLVRPAAFAIAGNVIFQP